MSELSRFFHAICRECWNRLNQDWRDLPDEFFDETIEPCCFCGKAHQKGKIVEDPQMDPELRQREGMFLWEQMFLWDPSALFCKGEHKWAGAHMMGMTTMDGEIRNRLIGIYNQRILGRTYAKNAEAIIDFIRQASVDLLRFLDLVRFMEHITTCKTYGDGKPPHCHDVFDQTQPGQRATVLCERGILLRRMAGSPDLPDADSK